MEIDSGLVKKLRSAKNWSQEQLSEACGLSLRTIQRLENTGKAPIESVRALAAVFQVDPQELILGKNDESLTPFDVVKTCFIKFANFSDTATRFEYWWFFAFTLFTAAVATILHEKAYQIVGLILLLPFLAVGTRRLNDSGHSGWWQLLFIVPFGAVVVFYMLALKSNILVSEVKLPMSHPEQLLSHEKIQRLDALYAARNENKRPTEWGNLVEALRAIRRTVEAGTAVRVEDGPLLQSWQEFYSWAHGRYHALEDGYDSWIGDDNS